MNYSLTLTALLVLVSKHILQNAGMDLNDSDLERFFSVLVDLICAVGIYVGRVRAGGLTWYGKRK